MDFGGGAVWTPKSRPRSGGGGGGVGCGGGKGALLGVGGGGEVDWPLRGEPRAAEYFDIVVSSTRPRCASCFLW